MSAGYGKDLKEAISLTFPHLNVVHCTATSGGEATTALVCVIMHWKDVDVLIYAPTISAGVSYDEIHFDMFFGVISTLSCTGQDYHQMLRRARKIKDPGILILNYSNFVLNDNAHYTTYEEMHEYCIRVKDINLRRTHENTGETVQIKYELDDFDRNYIFNRAEEDNSNEHTF